MVFLIQYHSLFVKKVSVWARLFGRLVGVSIYTYVNRRYCKQFTVWYPEVTLVSIDCTMGLLPDTYVKLRVAHAPEMPGTFSPLPRLSYPDMHHGACVTHVPWCMPGSLNSGFLWRWWRGKRSRHSRRMRNKQYCVSGKRFITHLSITVYAYTQL